MSRHDGEIVRNGHPYVTALRYSAHGCVGVGTDGE